MGCGCRERREKMVAALRGVAEKGRRARWWWDGRQRRFSVPPPGHPFPPEPRA